MVPDTEPTMSTLTPPSNARCPLRVLSKLGGNLWRFTQDDFLTFVFPNTIFGICVACAGSPFVSNRSAELSWMALLARIPLVILFNWTNLLIFDLANQRLWESVLEDKLNKPWRPIPNGRMTRSEVRQSLQLAIPLVLAINHYILGVGSETACIIVGCWVYNDLKASDDSWILRNAVIALGFGVFNWGSLKVAIGGGQAGTLTGITTTGYTWICLYSLVIFTTMHVQDMKDQAGNKARGRRTAPLIFGDRAARWTLAVPIATWTPVCALHCRASVFAATIVMAFGGYVAWRCLSYRGSMQDRWTWQLWCAWTAMLSLMPLRW
jgi:4-hydroxybenzoate polyprenyltransferase